MDIIWWINRLGLGEDTLLSYVGEHYFKHLLFVKLMHGSGLSEDDVSKCSFSIDGDNCLEFTVQLKKVKSIQEAAEKMEDNLSKLAYTVDVNKKKITAKIWSEGEELFSNGNIPYSHA